MKYSERVFQTGLRLAIAVCVLSWSLGPLPAALAAGQNAANSASADPVPTAGDYSDLEEDSYDPTTVVVKYKDSATDSAAREALEDAPSVDAKATEKAGELESSSLDDGYIEAQLEENADVTDAIEQLDADPAVEYAQPNYVYHLLDEAVEDETGATDLKGQSTQVDDPATKNSSTYKRGDGQAWHLGRINAYDAWDIAKSEHRVTVAVLDTGCNMDHEDLKDNILSDYAWDAYRDEKLTKDYSSEGHGTHCAGLVAATANNGKGTAGSSYNANVIPVQVFEPGDESQADGASTATLIKACDYVTKLAQEHPELGLHVINMSLGGASEGRKDMAFEKSIAAARAAGIVSVCAAGNGDGNGNTDESYTVPSDFDECYSVTALSTNGETPAKWSSRNKYKDICCPGECIYSTWTKGGDSYTYMSGTSMASPIVAGCFALLWAARPDLTVDEATEAITSTADTENFAPQVEGCYGAGVIDIAAAVKKVGVFGITGLESDLYSGQATQLGLLCTEGLSSVKWSVADGTGTAKVDADTGELTALMPGTVDVTVSIESDAGAMYSRSAQVNILPLCMDAAPTAADSADGIVVSWSKNSLAAGYMLQRATGDSASFSTIAKLDASTTSYVDNEVAKATSYCYRVLPFSAVQEEGTGTPSTACSCTHAPIVESTSPGLGTRSFVILPPSTNLGKLLAKKRSVKASWAKRAQASGYQLRYSLYSSMKKAKVKKVAKGSSKGTTVKKLKSKKRYYFQVRCYKKVGSKTYYSSWSSKKKVRVK